LLDSINIEGKVITADALLTQRKLAIYIVKDRKANYHFTVKANQKELLEDIKLFFRDCDRKPDFVTHDPASHGRIEKREIYTTTELNDYLKFPYVKQCFMIKRQVINKKTGKKSSEVAYGITSCEEKDFSAEAILAINRGHWTIENSCHYTIDWNYDEDRSRISEGYGPENMTRLRRFAVSLLHLKKTGKSIAEKMLHLLLNPRIVLTYLRITGNSARKKTVVHAACG
jgi:predicted transposase YbfD/YdcC